MNDGLFANDVGLKSGGTKRCFVVMPECLVEGFFPMTEATLLNWPAVTVIVPTYRDGQRLRRCLDHLMQQDYPGAYTVMVVDNEVEFALGALAKEYPMVQFLWQPKSGSYNARNLGIQFASSPYLAFTDSDCCPDPSWLRYGVAALAGDEAVGLVGGGIVVQAVDPNSITLGEYFEMAFGFPQRAYVREHRFAATANMFTKRSVIEAVGEFDGSLKAGGDSEWGKRVSAAGYSLIYEHRAKVTHPARNATQIMAKIKRTVGGARDRNPSWRSCLQFVLQYSIPPLRRMVAISRFQHPQLSWPTRGLLILYCLSVNWSYAFHRLLIQVSRAPSSR